MSSVPGVGGGVGGGGGIDPLRNVRPDQGVDPGPAKAGFDKLQGQRPAGEATGPAAVQDPLITSLREAAQSGLSSQAALEQVVKRQLDSMAGGKAPPEVVQQVLEAVRNDPSLSRILERVERASGQASS
jgi:hypothetical protein